MYDELVKNLRSECKYALPSQTRKALCEAADTIEKLQAEAKDWYLAYMDLLPTRWISVEEALPKPCETVLAYRVFGIYGQMSEVCLAHTLKIYDKVTWSMVGVTHWMPLPEPPMEES